MTHAGVAPNTIGPHKSAPLPSLYDEPHFYDIAFSPGTELQVDRLRTLFNAHQHCPTQSILEPACGSGRIVMGLAGAGYRVSGFDQNPLMVAFTAGRIAQSGLGDRVDVRRADMRDASYPRDYDAAVNLFNSLGHLRDDADIAAHFASVSRCLHANGLYVVQVDCAWTDPSLAEEGRWTAARDGISIEVQWSILGQDTAAKVSEQRCRMRVADRWGEHELVEDFALRLWSREDLERLSAREGFQLEAVHTEDLSAVPAGSPLSGELGNLYFVFRRVEHR
ncbi:MAG: class I SAM-dependent methyltransferase [Polyangiaceae bacterium]|nr:class I SAM-dependent methyltransferase [Polyangiaceae bacterium]